MHALTHTGPDRLSTSRLIGYVDPDAADRRLEDLALDAGTAVSQFMRVLTSPDVA